MRSGTAEASRPLTSSSLQSYEFSRDVIPKLEDCSSVKFPTLAFDPATRGFLSIDPLSPILGAGWDGNPYAYAGNNPLNTTDPTGLRPLTDDELKAYDGSSRGAFAAAGNWVKDNWEYVVGGLAVVGGAALMFVPGGQVAGLGLMSFGADVVIQKATTGDVNWGQAAISGGLGMVGGGVGMMAGKLVNNPVVRIAVENGVDGAISGAGGYLTGPGPHTPTGFIRATAVGTGTGALPIGGRAGKVDLPPLATTKLGDLPPTLDGMRGNPAANFTDGVYKSRYLSEDTILYRGGEAGKPWGRWWSEDAPISVEQVRNDKAVLPEWPGGFKSPIDSAFMARFPAGTAVHEGMTAPQTGLDGTIYPGGTPQVYIPDASTVGETLKEWRLP